jgi:hypothetical protein
MRRHDIYCPAILQDGERKEQISQSARPLGKIIPPNGLADRRHVRFAMVDLLANRVRGGDAGQETKATVRILAGGPT